VSDDKTDDANFVSFLESMLKKDPKDRVTVVDLLDDTWLTQDSSDPVQLFESSSTFS
jgi:serine/threonine protein kinase